jgi:hypothetical protein
VSATHDTSKPSETLRQIEETLQWLNARPYAEQIRFHNAMGRELIRLIVDSIKPESDPETVRRVVA